MSDRYLVDTNVFVYSFDSHAPEKQRKATQLIDEAISSRKGVVSYQVVQEFFSVAFRRFERPMRIADAQRYLSTVFRPLLAVHSSLALYLEAFRIQEEHRVPWYDALIVAGALQARCTMLYSEDFQEGRRFGNLQVRNPFS